MSMGNEFSDMYINRAKIDSTSKFDNGDKEEQIIF